MPMSPTVDDRWNATLPVTQAGLYRFSVRARVDAFGTWRHDLEARAAAGPDLSVELQVGAGLIDEAATRARAADRRLLAALGGAFRDAPRGIESDAPRKSPPGSSARCHGAHRWRTSSSPIDSTSSWAPWRTPPRAPRPTPTACWPSGPRHASAPGTRCSLVLGSPGPGRHGTFADVRARLDYVAEHGLRRALPAARSIPIGRTRPQGAQRRDRRPAPDDAGQPLGHRGAPRAATPPSTPSSARSTDFGRWSAPRRRAASRSPSTWPSSARPTTRGCTSTRTGSGTAPTASIRYAENPPKRYEDIYPIDFDDRRTGRRSGRPSSSVVRFWIAQGVRIFRVDNPHTKPFAVLGVAHRRGPGRAPRRHLPVRGVHPAHRSWSAWPSSGSPSPTPTSPGATRSGSSRVPDRADAAPSVADYFRPEPLAQHARHPADDLQTRRPAGVHRPARARRDPVRPTTGSTGQSSSCSEHVPRRARLRGVPPLGEVRDPPLGSRRRRTASRELIARVNRIRRDHPALQRNDSLRFHRRRQRPHLIATRSARPGPDGRPTIVVVRSSTSTRACPQSGWVDLDLEALGHRRERALRRRTTS